MRLHHRRSRNPLADFTLIAKAKRVRTTWKSGERPVRIVRETCDAFLQLDKLHTNLKVIEERPDRIDCERRKLARGRNVDGGMIERLRDFRDKVEAERNYVIRDRENSL
jgi:hypothetical protein